SAQSPRLSGTRNTRPGLLGALQQTLQVRPGKGWGGRAPDVGKAHAMSTFNGARLRALRKQAGLSLEHFAIAIGRTAHSVSRYECGAATPTMATLLTMADTLDVHPGELFTKGEA